MNFFNFRKNAEVAVIDFGSSKIVVFVGKKTPGRLFDCCARRKQIRGILRRRVA